MSDMPLGPNWRPRRPGETWSLKKIVEDITGKPLSEFQERPRPFPAVEPEPQVVNPPVASFLSRPDPVTETVVPEGPLPVPRRRLTYLRIPEHHSRKLTPREMERKYLAYLMLHLDDLPEPALKYLRQAVAEELKGRKRKL